MPIERKLGSSRSLDRLEMLEECSIDKFKGRTVKEKFKKI